MSKANIKYAVMDVESTGFGKSDRIIEIAIVSLSETFRVVEEYETLVDPQRDLGPTHVHGITPEMISMAPTFAEIATAISDRIANHVLVAHNLNFDQRMIEQEFNLLNASFDLGIGICTLKLTRQKLPEACRRLNIAPPDHHRALADARATAAILGEVCPATSTKPVSLNNLPKVPSIRTHRRCASEKVLPLDRLSTKVILGEGNFRQLQYLDLLDRVLDDMVVTVDELQMLEELTKELNLTESEITSAHEQYFHSVVACSQKDGVISTEENRSMMFIARALDIDVARVPAVNAQECGVQNIPIGSAICFTGSFVDENGDKISKKDIEMLATSHGFRIVSSVTKSQCDVLVAVDPSSSSGKAKKARNFGKPVIGAQQFFELIK